MRATSDASRPSRCRPSSPAGWRGRTSDEAAFGAYALPDPLDDCYRECRFVAGLDPMYYFALDNAGVCYCCKEWCVVFVVWARK
jgi:hypothetical protein